MGDGSESVERDVCSCHGGDVECAECAVVACVGIVVVAAAAAADAECRSIEHDSAVDDPFGLVALNNCPLLAAAAAAAADHAVTLHPKHP